MALANQTVQLNEQSRAQRALVRRILRVRPDVSPAQLVGILGGRLLDPGRERPTDRS